MLWSGMDLGARAIGGFGWEVWIGGDWICHLCLNLSFSSLKTDVGGLSAFHTSPSLSLVVPPSFAPSWVKTPLVTVVRLLGHHRACRSTAVVKFSCNGDSSALPWWLAAYLVGVHSAMHDPVVPRRRGRREMGPFSGARRTFGVSRPGRDTRAWKAEASIPTQSLGLH